VATGARPVTRRRVLRCHNLPATRPWGIIEAGLCNTMIPPHSTDPELQPMKYAGGKVGQGGLPCDVMVDTKLSARCPLGHQLEQGGPDSSPTPRTRSSPPVMWRCEASRMEIQHSSPHAFFQKCFECFSCVQSRIRNGDGEVCQYMLLVSQRIVLPTA
jgi:hypothetical protein